MSRTAIACLVCLLIAGCAAPTATPQSSAGADAPTTASSPTADPAWTTTVQQSNATTDSADATTDPETTRTSAEAGDIPVSGGSLPVEHERVFARTVDLLGANVSPPTVIVVKSAAEIRGDTGGVTTPGSGSPRRTFASVMGIGRDGESDEKDVGDADGEGSDDESGGEDESDGDESGDDDESSSDESGVSVAAYAPSAHSVVVNEHMTAAGRERTLERTLAHEFVHNVQFRVGAFQRVQEALDLRRSYSRDRYLTYVSVLEGTAVFVADAYDRRYLAGDWATITSAERYRQSPSGVKYAVARYYFGSRYLRHRFDSPRNVTAVYDDPPRTTEQLLHNDTDGSEAPERLSLSVEPGENRTLGRSNANGELFTRIALGTELNDSRAADAAAGWGADRLVPVEGANRSFVWATRWDSPAEADEFAAALAAYLDSRGEYSVTDAVWRDDSLDFRVVRVSDETVVLLAGDGPVVRNATVSGTNASASVSVA